MLLKNNKYNVGNPLFPASRLIHGISFLKQTASCWGGGGWGGGGGGGRRRELFTGEGESGEGNLQGEGNYPLVFYFRWKGTNLLSTYAWWSF